MIKEGAMAAGAMLGSLADAGQTVVKYNSILNDSKSLAGYTAAARVEPSVFVGSDLIYKPWISDILQTTQSLFAGMWLTAADMVTAQINGVSVLQVLDPLNPNRDPDYAAFAKNLAKRVGVESEKRYFSRENYKWALPTKKQIEMAMMAREADNTNGGGNNGGGNNGGGNNVRRNIEAVADDRLNRTINDASNLVAGKLLSIRTTNGNQVNDMRIALRMSVQEIPEEVLVELVGDKSINQSFKERLFDVAAGKIGWMDLIFCMDLFRERKRLIAKDKTEIVRQVRERQLKHKRAGLMTGNASMAEMSNIYVISTDTSDQLKARFGLDLDNFQQRQKAFENTSGMIFVVVDIDNERATFYTDTIARSTNIGLVDIKTANKAKDGNIMDIFNAYKEGASVRF
jgi:hypothetical protein